MMTDKPRDGWRRLLGLDSDRPMIARPEKTKTVHLGRGSGYAETALDREYERILNAKPGTVNDTTNRAAFSIGTLVGGGELEYDYVYGRLVFDLAAEKWNEAPDEDHVRTVESGLKSGIEHPRTAPNPDKPQPHAEEPEDELLAALARLEAALLTSADLDQIKNPEPLIEDLIFLDTITVLAADPGSGKSLTALDWAGCIGNGIPWHGKQATMGSVLYMVGEGMRGVKMRVRAWEDKNGVSMPETVKFLPYPVQADSLDWKAFELLCKRYNPSMVVIDTLAMSIVGRNENDPMDMGVLVDSAHRVRRQTEAAVVLVHHTNKGGGVRGSTALPAAADTIVRFKMEDGLVMLSTDMSDGGKQKDAAPVRDIAFRLEPHAESVVLKRVVMPL